MCAVRVAKRCWQATYSAAAVLASRLAMCLVSAAEALVQAAQRCCWKYCRCWRFIAAYTMLGMRCAAHLAMHAWMLWHFRWCVGGVRQQVSQQGCLVVWIWQLGQSQMRPLV